MKIKNMKIYNTIQNSGTVMHFLDQNLKIKSGEQLKHRNIMNEILWIYGIRLYLIYYRGVGGVGSGGGGGTRAHVMTIPILIAHPEPHPFHQYCDKCNRLFGHA